MARREIRRIYLVLAVRISGNQRDEYPSDLGIEQRDSAHKPGGQAEGRNLAGVTAHLIFEDLCNMENAHEISGRGEKPFAASGRGGHPGTAEAGLPRIIITRPAGPPL